jgi:hypothetical protein
MLSRVSVSQILQKTGANRGVVELATIDAHGAAEAVADNSAAAQGAAGLGPD